jgi:cytochrome c556|tara:strand:- start:68 stop:505 length:438 start_codon:yes stop_codon:yes gene_type:complete
MKKLILILIFFSIFFIPSHSNQSVEEIIKGRKAMFSANYQNAKKISILLKSKRIDEAKPLMEKISNNYKELLNYFPENTQEGFKTEALPSIWENKDEFNALMQKASDDMIELTKAINTVKDFQKIQKELMWNNCSSCHNRFRAPH